MAASILGPGPEDWVSWLPREWGCQWAFWGKIIGCVPGFYKGDKDLTSVLRLLGSLTVVMWELCTFYRSPWGQEVVSLEDRGTHLHG